MKQSLVKLVDVILKRIEEQPDASQNESGIRSWLLHQGYNKRDIEAAMKLVRPHFGPRQVQEYRPGSFRTLSAYEHHRLSAEARDALTRLEYYELITPFERETILDRLNHFDGPVGMEELDYLLTWLVCSERDYESQHTIYDVMEGRDSILH